jgi:hypothetical protein
LVQHSELRKGDFHIGPIDIYVDMQCVKILQKFT